MFPVRMEFLKNQQNSEKNERKNIQVSTRGEGLSWSLKSQYMYEQSE